MEAMRGDGTAVEVVALLHAVLGARVQSGVYETMALSKRNSRIINVNGVGYRWAISADSGHMWLIIESANSPGQRVQASFSYHDAPGSGDRSRQRRTISPALVRNMILHALTNGWRPEERGLGPLRLDGEAVCPTEER